MSSLASPVIALWGVGPTELIVLLLIILLLFGGAKLPSLARGLGQSIKEFKNASKDDPEAKEERKSGTKADSSKN